MSTKISWCSETYNPCPGCTKISEGCVACYAEKHAASTRLQQFPQYREVITNGKWNGKIVFVESALTKPLHWRKPRKIFVNSMGDTFHKSVPFEWVDRIMAVAALCPQHDFLFLTKRAGRQREYVGWQSAEPDIIGRRDRGQKIDASGPVGNWVCGFTNRQWPLPNVHYGATVENQKNVGRIADVIKTPGAKRFVSFEPLLGWIDVAQLWAGEFYCPQCRKFFDTEKFWMCPSCGGQIVGEDGDGSETTCPACKGTFGSDEEVPVCPNCNNCGGGRYIQPDYSSCFSRDLENAVMENVDYALIGCESGPKARLCTLDDIRHIMHQCREAGVKVHIKQIPLNDKCNKHIEEWPKEFQIREI